MASLEIFLAALSFFFLLLLRRRLRTGPGLPVDWPLIGMLPVLLLNLHRINEFAADVLRRSGCTFLITGPTFLLPMDNMLITADPANVNHVFNAAFSDFIKGPEFAQIFEILGDGIFTADGESWVLQRKKAQRLMGLQGFRSFVLGRINMKVENSLIPLMEGIVERGESVDLQDVFLRLTFDATCELVFGDDPGCLSPGFPTVPFAKAMDESMQVILIRHLLPPRFWKLLRWLGIGYERKLVEASAVIDDFIAKSIEEKKKKKKNSSESDNQNGGATAAAAASGDLLSSYLEDDDFRFDQTFLRDTTLSLMLAGRDTTAAALSWFFWLVSTHPKVESNLVDELTRTLRPTTMAAAPSLTHEELNKLIYLHAALCEALRLYPPVPLEIKTSRRRGVLPSGHDVSPEQKVIVSLYAMGRMNGVWGDDAGEFLPERWIISGEKKASIRYEPSYKFMAFNTGARSCLGKDVAFTQMKAVAAAVLRRFAVEVVAGHVVEPKPSIILHMKHGLMVKLRRRSTLSR